MATSAGFHAEDVVVDRFTFEARPELRSSESLPQPSISFAIRSRIDRAARRINVVALLAAGDPSGKRAPFVAQATISAVFTWNEPVQLPVEEFARLNAVGFLWPYARELIWNFTIRTGFPALLLPILNFRDVKIDVEEVPPSSSTPTAQGG